LKLSLPSTIKIVAPIDLGDLDKNHSGLDITKFQQKILLAQIPSLVSIEVHWINELTFEINTNDIDSIENVENELHQLFTDAFFVIDSHYLETIKEINNLFNTDIPNYFDEDPETPLDKNMPFLDNFYEHINATLYPKPERFSARYSKDCEEIYLCDEETTFARLIKNNDPKKSYFRLIDEPNRLYVS